MPAVYITTRHEQTCEEEFLQYQTMDDSDIPTKIWEVALIKEDNDEDTHKY